MVKGILFDLDGTLVDSYEAISFSLNKAREHFGLEELTVDEIRKMVGLGLEVLVEKSMGKDNVKEGVRIFREHYGVVFSEKTKVLPQVAETVIKLHRLGIKMAVTSNKPSKYCTPILENFDLARYMTIILGPMDVANAKPEPDMVFKALETMNLNKNEVAYVGDMVVDIETCRNAGIPVWVIPSGSQTREELMKGKPDIILYNFSDIVELVGGDR